MTKTIPRLVRAVMSERMSNWCLIILLGASLANCLSAEVSSQFLQNLSTQSVPGTFTEEEIDSAEVAVEKTIFSTHGTIIFSSIALIGIESQLMERQDKFFLSTHFRIAAGYWRNVDLGGGPTLISSITALSGSGNHHFELQGGLAIIADRVGYRNEMRHYERGNRFTEPSWEESFYALPVVSVGYRYKSPKEGAHFRAGLGVPYGFYMSLGLGLD